jgi:hypothetical protein
VVNQIKYLLDCAHERAFAIYSPDSSPEIPERIAVQNALLTVVGIDDPAVGHTRAHLHIPDSIESMSRRSFCHSFVQSLTVGVAGPLRFSEVYIERKLEQSLDGNHEESL